MTENEAKAVRFIENIKSHAMATLDHIAKEKPNVSPLVYKGREEKADTILTMVEELKQYRQIGSVEEFRAAMEKQIAKKPEFIDTRFMNNGKHISDGCQLQNCYKCPNCNQHIFHVWDDELYCKYCGQLLDWSDDE